MTKEVNLTDFICQLNNKFISLNLLQDCTLQVNSANQVYFAKNHVTKIKSKIFNF